jgi:hypothetical protein
MDVTDLPPSLAGTLLRQLLPAGETRRLEFKRVSGKMVGKALETVCAFANTQGGTLVLGMADLKEFQGTARLFGVEEIHRDYRLNRDIFVRIFDDRVEVESPGLLPGTITPATIARAGSKARNPLIAVNLREFPDPPNIDAGEGVPMMFAEMAQAELYPPQYRQTTDAAIESVTVTLFNLKRPQRLGRGERLDRPRGLDRQCRCGAHRGGGHPQGVQAADRLARAGAAGGVARPGQAQHGLHQAQRRRTARHLVISAGR